MVNIGSICAVATAISCVAAHPSFIYKFDAAKAGGVKGFIKVKYASETSSTATITANLDFSRVNQTEIGKFDGNCTEPVTSWKWHIHTKWGSTQSSASYKQCSKAATDNHYDPLKACGPASEYVSEESCKAKSKSYVCNPGNYTTHPEVCEKGDLSGKFGAFEVGKTNLVSKKWEDKHFPLLSENKDTWSIVLHAVCGKEAPRISCAVKMNDDEKTANSPRDADCNVKM
ncbi:hypothetical protein L916_00514 [Plasmopara halstedii]|uniref:Uncharacterized protein n=1 Tax=Plasmopara halstedii TaxID=4781 RepID=A0A0P1B195_PLAHL|nr:hypothetical protein L916_00514 [Plasmopara halstedii]CEG48504.1 hypothetical protein L916_00514 [Plasmopara halstedii]|eukprot:XP_024584873.1 hypothetical protein L916_00514 [Plasmopara halstedii]